MEKKNITAYLFNIKEDIQKLMLSPHKIGSSGPRGVGYSPLRAAYAARGYENDPVKYSGIALALEVAAEATKEKKIKASKFNECVYLKCDSYECSVESENNEFYVRWNGSEPHGIFRLIPVIVGIMANPEMTADGRVAKLAEKLINDFQVGFCQEEEVLQFCDAFYYEYVKASRIKTMTHTNDLNLEEILQLASREEGSAISIFPLPDFVVEKQESQREQKEQERTSYLNGEHFLPIQWDDEQKLKIPDTSFLEDFIPVPTFYDLLLKFKYRQNKIIERIQQGISGVDAIKKDYINLTIAGKPGTGKTTVAYALGAALHMPVYTVACSKHTEEDEFQGKTKVVKGKLDFMTTDFLEAYQNGGIIVLEELNLSDPAVTMGALGQAIEFPFILKKDGYETVRRHPNCIIISTMNIGTFGSKQMSQALSSRHKQTFLMDDPKKEDFIRILETSGGSKAICEWAYTVYSKIINFLSSPDVNEEDVCMNVTLRACLGMLENIEEGMDPHRALQSSLIGKIAECDMELAKRVETTVLMALPKCPQF